MKQYNCIVCGDMGQIEVDPVGLQCCPRCHGLPITPGSVPVTLWFSKEAIDALEDMFPAGSPEASLKEAVVFAGLRQGPLVPKRRQEMVDTIANDRGLKKPNWLQRVIRAIFNL